MKILSIIFTLISSMIFLGCQPDTEAEQSASAITVKQLHGEPYPESGVFTTKQTKVIHSQSQYENELAVYSSDKTREVDFDTSQVLLIDVGQKNNGGYGISINEEKTGEAENSVMVTVTLTSAGPTCPVTMALTNPYAFYLVTSKKNIVVQEELITRKCD